MSFVQAKSAQGISANSVTTAGITTTTGNQVYIGTVSWGPAGVADGSPAITDTFSNTWTKVGGATDAGHDNVQLWYCASITGGASHTFTYHLAAVDYCTISVFEFSSMTSSSPLDVGGNTYFAAGTTSSFALPSLTTLNANDVLIAVGGGGNGGSAGSFSSTGDTWTLPAAGQQTNINGEMIAFGYVILSATGTHTITWSNPGGGDSAAGSAAFKQASAGAPAYYPFRRYLHLPEWEV